MAGCDCYRPGGVVAIADALAKRADVNWVALSTAGCEITCATQSRTREQREDLLGQRLPRTAAVLDINAFAVLRQFMGGRGHHWAALQGALSPEKEAMLGSDGSAFTESPLATRDPVHLTAEDEKILDTLAGTAAPVSSTSPQPLWAPSRHRAPPGGAGRR
ncbi:hypothetical protein ACFYRG_48240 [Streptomyces mirabilis]|uniref:hypothetical protein n=1 Tax=Streptomyces mirabilis TaxID=68239 RepID=UPI003683E15E